MMPLADIQLLFETLVQRTRKCAKSEKRANGSEDCNASAAFFREPAEKKSEKTCCTAK
jgi:hypothetical protein